MASLSPSDARLLAALRPAAPSESGAPSAPSSERALEELACELSLNADTLRRSSQVLSEAGLISVRREESVLWEYTPAGLDALAAGLPEYELIQKLSAGPVPVVDLGTSQARMGIGLAMALRAKLVALLPDKRVSLTDAGRAALAHPGAWSLPSVEKLSSLPDERLSEFKRRNLVSSRTHSSEWLSITPEGGKALQENESAATSVSSEGAAPAAVSFSSSDSDSISILKREHLLSGSWKKSDLRRYDVTAPVQPQLPARRHPMARLRERVRSIFLGMGFEEMEGPMAESAFWNFDALFQPQDHPARDLADTFYLPGESPRPESELRDAVKGAHEKGWRYEWSERVARQMVMRTHTTAVSARTLRETAGDSRPRKFFCIGKVFRNEATDYKHLAEFFQVEGIISWEGATFGHLLGTLKAFYSKLGFEQIRFRPSFFPYTEPSLEIEVFHPARQAWLELGGAGIMRPEVCEGLGCRYPVLAWGLSLERPLMLGSQIEDIRTLYRNDLGWLRNFPVSD
ncbi:Phenylalanine--tRNA ligase alpha subunit [uncultured archaeon]|nr:Phenylalanine--tRNA ligase alpha subunit [uncultured archaeon]